MAQPETTAAAPSTYKIMIEERAADGSTKTSSVSGEAPVAAAFLRAAAEQMAPPRQVVMRPGNAVIGGRTWPPTIPGPLDGVELPAPGTGDGKLVFDVRARINTTPEGKVVNLVGQKAVWAYIQAIHAERPGADFSPDDRDLQDAVARRVGFTVGTARLWIAHKVMAALRAIADGDTTGAPGVDPRSKAILEHSDRETMGVVAPGLLEKVFQNAAAVERTGRGR